MEQLSVEHLLVLVIGGTLLAAWFWRLLTNSVYDEEVTDA